MDTIRLLTLILATWRISSLLVYEDGPFEIFERLRHRAGVVYNEHSQREGTNDLAKGLTCLWCVSVWVSAFWVVLLALSGWCLWLALPFAISGGAVLVEQWMGER